MATTPSLDQELIDLIVAEMLARATPVCEDQVGSFCIDCGVCAAACSHRTRAIVQAGATRISSRLGVDRVPSDIAQYIDHTLLKPDATSVEIQRLCDEARQYRFAAVCINPPFVKQCAESLRGSGVAVAAVVGFPLGAHLTGTKVFETQQAILDGATEVDMVVNVGELKAKNDRYVLEDIRAVVDTAHRLGGITKVIIEAALLNDEEKVRACLLSKEAGADFVKTSTGFGPGGATVQDVALMRATVGSGIGVKAAGGVKNYTQAKQMIAAGATRIGASAGVAIVKEARGDQPSGPGSIEARY